MELGWWKVEIPAFICLNLPGMDGDSGKDWNIMPVSFAVMRLDILLLIIVAQIFKVIDYQIDEAFMDHRLLSPSTTIREVCSASIREICKAIFVSSVSSQHGLTEDSRFPWPVIDMAEFENRRRISCGIAKF